MGSIQKKFKENQRMIFVLGAVLFTLGLLRYVLAPGRWGVNSRTQLPTVVSGAEFMVMGAVLLACWLYTLRNKDKAIKMERDEMKKMRRHSYNWNRKKRKR
jgi:hypothetical protein